jgi:hypothetical protein
MPTTEVRIRFVVGGAHETFDSTHSARRDPDTLRVID